MVQKYLKMKRQPIVMGILNITPDSFFDGGSYLSDNQIIDRVEKMVREGVSIIDVGGFSTKPNFNNVSAAEESDRVLQAIEIIHKYFPTYPISVDTFRADVAQKSIEAGANIINDISGGVFDEAMFSVIAKNPTVEYVLMHGGANIPEDLHQTDPDIDIVKTVQTFLAQRMQQLIDMGVEKQRIILDQGFGFGKTISQNYELMRAVPKFVEMGRVLVGISRKSMIFKTLKITPQQALTGTIALNVIALMHGAEILRVHDVKEAMETITIFMNYQS